MIESVAVRQRGAYDFETHYNNLCALQSSCPSPAVKAHLNEGVLDVNGDRIRVTDWVPILNSLRINKTLGFVAIRSYFQQSHDESDKRVGVRKKTPAIRSKEITYRLCKSLKECLSVTPALTCIELQGLPLRERDLTSLAKGLTNNATLTHISLEYSALGDDGLEVICKGIKNSPSVTSLNFTGCGLSWKGSGTLATVIKHQAMKRHNEAWQDSLRYRRPDLDRMSGIRRITINANPMVGEKGAQLLAEALKDDLWLKALDMQQCGLTNVGAQALLDVLKYNTTIVVLDVRKNPMIDQDIIRSIMEQVMINCNGQDTEYKWIRTDAMEGKGGKSKKKRTRTLQSSFGKKTTIKVSTSSQGRRRSKSATSVTHTLQPLSAEVVKPGPGMPWRTALRADRYRGYPSDHEPGQASLYQNLSSNSSPSSPTHDASSHLDYTEADETTETPGGELDYSDVQYGSDKKVRVELEQLRRRLREEGTARSRADEKVLELSVENQRLRHQLEVLQEGGSTTLLDDDQVLDNIEKSFQQFHSFLDMLRDAGLGQLIKLAGLDQATMPFSRSDLQAGRTTPFGPLETPQPSGQQAQIDVHPPSRETISHSSLNDPPQSSTVPAKINIVPDNHRHTGDPTMQGEASSSHTKPKTKFDELYAKVLRETDGALDLNRGADDTEGPLVEPESSRHGSLKSKSEQHSTGDLSERSHSQHSQPSHSRSKHSSSSRHAPVPIPRSNSKGGVNNNNNNYSGHSNGSLHRSREVYSSDHDYSQDFEITQSDISDDIENIQYIHDLMPVPDNSPLKDMASEEEDF